MKDERMSGTHKVKEVQEKRKEERHKGKDKDKAEARIEERSISEERKKERENCRYNNREKERKEKPDNSCAHNWWVRLEKCRSESQRSYEPGKMICM
jgi:hypothetical protein